MSCEFCKNADFSEFSTDVTGGYAHISLAAGSYRFPKDEQFAFCPRCGEPLFDPQPLTLNELREKDGKPVYIVVTDKNVFADKADAINGWGLVRRSWVVLWDRARADMVHINHDFEDYGKTWVAYDRTPKEV